MEVEVLNAYNPECEAFVRSSRDGMFCHLQKWGLVVSQTFGHATFNLVARREGVVCGLLPLTLVRSRIFGCRLISQAFCNYGGPLLSDATALVPLLDRAIEVAGQLKCPRIEFRATSLLRPEFHLNLDKVCMRLPLLPDPDEIWRRFRPEIRNRVRRAESARLTVLDGGEELVDDFYDVWSRRMRELGTPCYPRSLFRRLCALFPLQTRIFLAKDGRVTVGGGLFCHFKGLVESRWFATRITHNRLAPSSLLLWAAIKYYCLTGARTFDFGRSTLNSGQYEFKRRWGAKKVQLYYQSWASHGGEVSLIRPDNPRYAFGMALWKRLPLRVSQLVGPYLGRSLA